MSRQNIIRCFSPPNWLFGPVWILLYTLMAVSLFLVLFFLLTKEAGLLLVPYWLWVSFASILNFFIWRLN